MKTSALVCVLCMTAGCRSNSAEHTTPSTDAGRDGAAVPEDYFGWGIVERFTRDGLTKSASSLLLLHKDKDTTEPRMERIDDRCLFHTPLRWDLTGHLPPSFGTVTQKGPGDFEIECEQQPNYYTTGGMQGAPILAAGDTIELTATGAVMPAFDFSGIIPQLPTLTSQNLATLKPFEWTIHLAEPLDLTWIPTSGEVQAMIIQLGPTGQQQGALRCVFPGEDGAAIIPAETMSHIPIGGDATEANFYFFGTNRQTRAIQGLEMEFMTINGLAVRVVID